MTERRKAPRIKVNWPIEVSLDDRTIEGIAKNITLKGLFVCCDEPLSFEENYRISIFTHNHKAINVVGKPIWSDSYAKDDKNAPVCIGLSFIKISTKNLHSLKEIIQIRTEE